MMALRSAVADRSGGGASQVRSLAGIALVTAALAFGGPAHAQDYGQSDTSTRYRVSVGPQFKPSYPGSDQLSLRPYFGVSRARGDAPFEFEAPDESTSISIVDSDGFAFGPAVAFQSSRTPRKAGVDIDRVGFTIEAGAFVQYQFSPSFRVHAEARRGLGGHNGWIGTVGADYIVRNRDNWLFSIGPRVTYTNRRYQAAYFDITPAESARTGLSQYSSGGGIQAVGATSSMLYQFSPHWGVVGYVKYDRLIGDPGDSPLVRRYGSRNQMSTGIALSYTFTR